MTSRSLSVIEILVPTAAPRQLRRMNRRPFVHSHMLRSRRCAGPVAVQRWASNLANVLRLQSLRSLSDIELHVVALGEAAEALCLDCREVHEHVWTRLLPDKAKALRVVKPLHLTLSHTVQTSAHGGTAPDWNVPDHRGRGRAQTKTARRMVLAEAQTAGDGATYA